MPKEIVVSHGPRFYDDAGVEIPQESQGVAEVAWSREAEYVQLVTYARHPVSFDTIGRNEAQFVQLTRKEINDFIKHLRRARDQAFGRDE